MKITGLSVKRTQDGAGHLVTISAFVPNNEKLEADDVARLLDVLKEAAGVDNPEVPPDTRERPVSRDTNAGNVSSPETGTRRRRATSADTDAPAETAPSEPKAGATSAPDEAGGRRRRRVTQEAPAEDQGNAGGGASTNGAGSSTSGGESSSNSSGTAASTRRRRATPSVPSTDTSGTTSSGSSTTGTKTETTKSPSKLKDADMSKAASAAAMKIGSEAVMLLVGEYVDGDNPKVNQIADDLRAEFIERLDAMVEKYG